MAVPDLSLDVLYVIACHLAGMFAFGTLAALHLANHDVAETVLPVLYETILADNMKHALARVAGENERHKDAFRRYTKSLICLERDDADNVWSASGMSLPKLIAILVIFRDEDYGTAVRLEVDLRQPVTSAVLFGLIASTPGYPPITQQTVLLSELDDGLPNVSDDSHPAATRSVLERQLHSFIAAPGAFLVPNSTMNAKWVTNTQLFDTRGNRLSNGDGNDKFLNTIFEALKLAGHQSNPSRMRENDETASKLHRLAPDRYHINLQMDRQQYDALLKE